MCADLHKVMYILQFVLTHTCYRCINMRINENAHVHSEDDCAYWALIFWHIVAYLQKYRSLEDC